MSHLQPTDHSGPETSRAVVRPGSSYHVLGIAGLVVSLPFLFVVVPTVRHLDPFVLAHAGRHLYSGSNPPPGFLQGATVVLDLIWLVIVYFSLIMFLGRQTYDATGVTVRKVLVPTRLRLDQVTSIALTDTSRARGYRNLQMRTGIALDAPGSPLARPSGERLLINGMRGRRSRSPYRLYLQPENRGARAATEVLDGWVRQRPELVKGATRDYFVARGALQSDSAQD